MKATASMVAGVILCMGLGANSHAQSFVGLGDLPGGEFNSSAGNLSGDGRFVSGSSQIDVDLGEAFLWTEQTGMIGLGMPSGSDRSGGAAVSNDGSVVVGSHAANPSPTNPPRAMRWTSGGGPVDFDPFPVGAASRNARALSADGGTIVGNFSPFQGSNTTVYHWSGGTLTEIDDSASAGAVSADGSVVVGNNLTVSPGPVPVPVFEAFIWTEAEGMSGLGFLPGGSLYSSASGISADGQVVVGGSESTLGMQAFRWTESGGMDGLGDLPGGDFDSSAHDTTADGSIVVGRSNVLGGQLTSSSDPFIWDEVHGMRNLVDVLTNDFGLGSALAGWNLTEATAISDNGKVIIGNGINPDGNFEAWRAVLVPEPSTALLGGLACVGLLTFRRRSG